MKPFRKLFLVAGVPKAGTTALEIALRATTKATLPSIKEPHYLCKQINSLNRAPLFQPIINEEDYLRQFKGWQKHFETSQTGIDCDPLSFQDSQAARAALELADEVKAVIILRNPVDRFISHFLNDWRECIEDRPLDAVLKTDLISYQDLGGRYLPYTWHSYYAPWIKLWVKKLGRERLLFLKFDDIHSKPLETSRKITEFFNLPDLSRKNLFSEKRNTAGHPRNSLIAWMLRTRQRFPSLRWLYSQVPQQSREYVREKILFAPGDQNIVTEEQRSLILKNYENDIAETENLLDWDLSNWRTLAQSTQRNHLATGSRNTGGRFDGIVAIVWAQFGPYHLARLRALRQEFGSHRILGVEIANKTLTYAWERGAVVEDGLVTLLPGAATEQASAVVIYRAAFRLFRQRKVDVVFVPSYWPASSLAVIMAARNADARVVMMTDSHALTAKARGVWAEMKRRLVLHFDAALVAGVPQKDYFSRLGMRPEKIVLGYDAVDNGYYAANAAKARGDPPSPVHRTLGCGESSPDAGRQAKEHQARVRAKHGLPERYFLNVGRMVWKKNLEILIDAYKLAKDRLGTGCPRLVLVGSGRLERSLRERCLGHGLSTWQATANAPDARSGDADVLFYGFRQVEELSGFYALASAFILPSREEEWGLVVNEAMACGLPVLVSRVAGCAQDLVREGENGFLFDPFDADGLAGHLEKIARQPELTTTMGEASSRIIADWGCDRFARAAHEATDIALGNAISEGLSAKSKES